MHESLDTGVVDVYMPTHPEALVLARLQVTAVGRFLDLDVDELADLRLATEELCLLALADHAVAGRRLHLILEWEPSTISAACELTGPDSDVVALASPDPLSSQILGALTDEVGVRDGPEGRRVWFRKKRVATG
jgi:hypothetical protein